jgi:hypothetical protein
MRKRTIWTLVGAAAAIPLVMVAVGIEWLLGPSQLLYKPVRYRVATSVDVGDHGRIVRSVVHSDCWAFASTRGVVRGVRKSRTGEDNHLVLGDRSVLILPDLDPCRWVDAAPAVGTMVALAPTGRASRSAGSGDLWAGEAWRFDHARDPQSVTIYDLPALFGSSSDGLQIMSATVAAVAERRDNAFALEDSFAWLREVPRGSALEDLRNYWNLHHHGNFLGFRATVTQLVDGSRCPVRDAAAEGPIVIPMQAPCTQVSACTQGGDGWFCGSRMAWLTASVKDDFSEVSYAISDRSEARIAVLHRETTLMKAGAPGDRSHPSLRWKPRICLDGLCIAGETASTGVPPWTQFYYPRRNQLVTVWPLSFYAADAFRRSGASF